MDSLAQHQVIDAAMARALHRDVVRDHVLAACVVWQDHPAHPNHRFIAQFATASPLPDVLVGETLAEVQAQLPPGLVRYGRQAVDRPEVVELWVAA